MSNKKKKSRWDFLGKKVESEEELKEKFGQVIPVQPPAAPTEQVSVEEGGMLYEDFLEKLYKKKAAEIEEEKVVELKKPHPFINWFQKSSWRMCVGLTIVWVTLFQIVFTAVLFTAAFVAGEAALGEFVALLLAAPISGIFWGFVTATVVPRLMVHLLVREKFSWVRFIFGIVVLFWYWILGWLPRKAFEWYFYKFTNLYKGIQLSGEGKYRQAIAELEEYKPQKADTEENYIFYSALGDCYYHIGEFDKVVTAYQKAVNVAPEELESKLNLAAAYIYNNQHNEGLSLLRELRQKYPENVEILITMARSYLVLGMFDEALALLMEARSLKPMDPIILKMLAEVYLGKGMKKEAIESANKALSLNPPPDIAEEVREIINILS